MARSIRSKRGKELRRIQREKLATWDKQRIQKLSNALAKSKDHVKYFSDGAEKNLSEEQQQKIAEQLNEVAMDMSDDKTVEKPAEEETKNLSYNQIMKAGVPKRKKRNTKKYGKNGKKIHRQKAIPKVR